MKKLALIYFILFSFFADAKTVSAYLDLGRFKVNDTLNFVELYLGIDANSVEFQKNDDGKLQANVFVSIILLDDDKITYFESFNVKSPIVEGGIPNFNKFNFSKRIFTENKNYKCELTLKDNLSEDSAQTSTFDIKNNFKESSNILFSDIQLLESFEKSDSKNDFTKGGYLMNPLTSSFYPSNIKILKYYLEVYNTDTDKSLGEKEPFVMFTTFRDKNGRLLQDFGSYKRDSARSTIRILNQIDISKLPSGNYFLVVEIRNKENKLISYTTKEIQRANIYIEEEPEEATDELLASNFSHAINIKKLNYYLDFLKPISTEVEQTTISSLLNSGDSTKKETTFLIFGTKGTKVMLKKNG